MKLKAIDVTNNLKYLELGEVVLYAESSKSISLIIRENNTPQLAVTLNKEVHYFSLSERSNAQKLFDSAFVISSEIYNDKEKFIDFINKCEVGVKYKFNGKDEAIKIYTEDNRYCYIHYFYGFKSQPAIAFKTDSEARLSLINQLNLSRSTYVS